MEIDRRSLMKGMLAGGALLALGAPPWSLAGQPARRPSHCVLLLGGTSADGLFEIGARTACAKMTDENLQTLKLKDGLLAGTDRIVQLLEQSRGARWIAVMDDASSVIFLELARTAGVRLLAMGTHACSTDGPWPIRHDLASTSVDYGAGSLLASHFIQRTDSFYIAESFLQEPAEKEGHALISWGAPGFSSYRFTEPDAIHVHCSGCSLSDSRQLLGLETTDGWVPIPPRVCANESVTRRSENWVESVGYAMTASALGIDSVRESCMRRAFVHQSSDETRTQPMERFVSFVMDI